MSMSIETVKEKVGPDLYCEHPSLKRLFIKLYSSAFGDSLQLWPVSLFLSVPFPYLSFTRTKINKHRHTETFCTPLERNLNLFKKLFSISPQNHLPNFIYFGRDAVTDVHYYETKTRSECGRWLTGRWGRSACSKGSR